MSATVEGPVFQGPDNRSNAEFLRELANVRALPLMAQLRFMRNKRNRDRAMSIPKDKLTRMLNGKKTPGI